jgi:hypothetical protein
VPELLYQKRQGKEAHGAGFKTPIMIYFDPFNTHSLALWLINGSKHHTL